MAKKDEGFPAAPSESRPATLDAVLDETSDIILIINKRLRIRESSRTAQAALGLPPGEGKGLPLEDFLSAEDDGSLLAALSSRESREGKMCVGSSFKQADGGCLRARVTVRPLAKEGAATGRTLLICKRLDASSAVGDSSRFGPLVERVLRAYADPVLVLDATRRTILKCNDPALAAFGWKREELVGALFDMLSEGGAFADDLRGASQIAYAASGVFQSRLRLKRKDGVVLSCVCTNVALFDERGLIESVLCVLHDKSDEERRKAELGQLVAEAAALSARLESAASRLLDPGSRPRLSDRGLSRRHIEIIARVASGLTTKAIARELGLAEATVKSHLSTIYRKLEIRSRTELLRYLYDNGYRID